MASTGTLYIHLEDCVLDQFGQYLLTKNPLPVYYDTTNSTYMLNIRKKIMFIGDFRSYHYDEGEQKFVADDPLSSNGVIDLIDFKNGDGHFYSEGTIRDVNMSASIIDGIVAVTIAFQSNN